MCVVETRARCGDVHAAGATLISDARLLYGSALLDIEFDTEKTPQKI
jgi:hypothetical protein